MRQVMEMGQATCAAKGQATIALFMTSTLREWMGQCSIAGNGHIRCAIHSRIQTQRSMQMWARLSLPQGHEMCAPSAWSRRAMGHDATARDGHPRDAHRPSHPLILFRSVPCPASSDDERAHS